jgi:predicted permease
MVSIILTIIPLFLIIAVGAFTKWIKFTNDEWINILNKFALYAAFPALIFSSLTNASIKGNSIDYKIILYNLILLIVLFFIIYLICFIFKIEKKLRNTYILCILFGNVAYLGFPYISSIISGQEAQISIIIATYVFITFTFGIWILESTLHKKANIKEMIKEMIKNPLLLSVILGIIALQAHIIIPDYINKALQMLGSSASPIVLFALGIFLVRKIKLNKKLLHSLIIASIKIIFVPILFIIVNLIFIKNNSFDISIIESGMPTAITVFALSQKYPLEKEIIVYTTIIGTILSAITLPIITSLVI